MRALHYSDDEIREAVSRCQSIACVMRALGIKPAGGSHYNISKRIARLGLDTSHFTGRGHNAGKRQPRKPPEEILIRKSPDLPRTKAHLLRRALLEIGRPHRCESCGTGAEWRGRALTLHVDHIDGDAFNSTPGNLRFLCPNCHSQTDSYCRKLTSRRGDQLGT